MECTQEVEPPWPSSASPPNAVPNAATYPPLYSTDTPSSGLGADQTRSVLNDIGFDYGFPQVQSIGTQSSPGNNSHHGSSNDTSSRPQSNHPTPSTSSNHTSSYTSNTSPQNPLNNSSSYNDSGQSLNQAQPFQQPQVSREFVFRGQSQWTVNAQPGIIDNPDLSELKATINLASTGMTPGHTGMTPLPDGMWPADPMSENGDWLFAWPGQTPQPQ